MNLIKSSHSLVLSDLPVELLQLIFGNFCLHCCEPAGVPQVYFPERQQERDEPSWYALYREALHSVCLTSRRLRDVAQPILYHEFIPGFGSSGASMRYEWGARFTRFLRTVTECRDLAGQVKELYLSHALLNPIRDNDYSIMVALEKSAPVRGINLIDFLQPFRELPDRKPFGPFRPTADEPVAILISCLPNLSRLYITDYTPACPIPSAALRAAGIQSLPL
ncbi:hypothetical protein F5Y16DRAFT_18464 [Xylariaceae sp. FL0255]|nr:hypothetical protein F5Y16DRAFT_18464 [Xylariaceae sp. FL0255]